MRTIRIEDDEFDDLLSEKEDLEDEISTLRTRIGDLEEVEQELVVEMNYFEAKWNDKTELLKRIGELS